MNDIVKNFFLDKTKRDFTKEFSDFRFPSLLLAIIQYLILNFSLTEASTGTKELFLKFSNIILVLAVAIVILTSVDTLLRSLSKVFHFSIGICIYLITLIYLGLYSFNNIELLALCLITAIFMLLPLKQGYQFLLGIISSLILIILSYYLSPVKSVGFLIIVIAFHALILSVEGRYLRREKYVSSIQNFLASITNTSKDLYFLINKNLLIESSNNYSIVIWGEGYKKSLAKMAVTDLFSEESKEDITTNIKRVFNNKTEVEKEVLMIDTKGKKFWVLIKLILTDILGTQLVLLSAKDISLIKDAETTLRKTLLSLADQQHDMEATQKAMVNMLEDIEIQKRIAEVGERDTKTILENIADPVIVLNKNRQISVVNKAAVKFTQYDESELIDKDYSSVIKIFTEKENTPYTEYLEKAYRGEIAITEQNCFIITKVNEKINISIAIAPTFTGDGHIDRCIIIIKDVSKARQVERMKDEFVSIASHQLRTPLTSIKWHAEIIKDSENLIPVELKPSIDFIAEGSERLIHLVSELLDVSRIDTGRNFDLLKTDQDLPKLIDKILEEQKILAENKKIKLAPNYNSVQARKINVDAFKITEAISNIISNAIKYSKEESQVGIDVSDDGTNVFVKVSDTGMGIPPEEQGRIFERFYRAKNAVTQEGTGLGLYITKAIILAHGGELSFTSEMNKGTTFIIKLPLK